MWGERTDWARLVAVLHAKEGEMNVVRTLKRRLGLDFADQAERQVKQDERAAAGKVAQRYSRGSVGIQRGAFRTRDDIDGDLARAGIPPAEPRTH